MDIDGHPLDDLVLDAWQDLATTVRYVRSTDAFDRPLSADHQKLGQQVYLAAARRTKSEESGVVGADNEGLSVFAGPATAKRFDKDQARDFVVNLIAALGAKDIGIATRGSQVYAVRFHCAERDTHWFWLDVFRQETGGGNVPLVTIDRPEKALFKYNLADDGGAAIVEYLLVNNPAAVSEPIVAHADTLGQGEQARSLLRQLGFWMLYAVIVLTTVVSLGGVLYARSPQFRQFVDRVVQSFKKPVPEPAPKRSRTSVQVVAPPPPALLPFIIHSPPLADLVPLVRRTCSGNATVLAHVLWNVPPGVPPPYVLLVNDEIRASIASPPVNNEVAFDVPLETGQAYTLKFGVFSAHGEHLLASGGTEYTAVCDEAAQPAPVVAASGTANGITATFFTAPAAQPAAYEPTLEIKNTARAERMVAVEYETPDEPFIMLTVEPGQTYRLPQLFTETFGVRPKTGENVLRVTTVTDKGDFARVAELRYDATEGFPTITASSSTRPMQSQTVTGKTLVLPPRIGDTVLPSKGTTTTQFTFRASPRMRKGETAVQYRWFFTDCLARALRHPDAPDVKFADCYSAPKKIPVATHRFVVPGTYEVRLEARYPSGQFATERFCIMQIAKAR
jgi:hypothetical protein